MYAIPINIKQLFNDFLYAPYKLIKVIVVNNMDKANNAIRDLIVSLSNIKFKINPT